MPDACANTIEILTTKNVAFKYDPNGTKTKKLLLQKNQSGEIFSRGYNLVSFELILLVLNSFKLPVLTGGCHKISNIPNGNGCREISCSETL